MIFLILDETSRMTQYFTEAQYDSMIFGRDEMNLKEFEGCIFSHCDFTACNFIGITFIDCIFNHCNFDSSKINHTAFRTVHFKECSIIDVNFAMCDKLIFEIHFENCKLDFSKFYTLKIKGTDFSNCSLIAVDFMKANLTGVLFDRCDLYKAVFVDTILEKTDFRTSFNYTLDPEKNKFKKTAFSLENLKGLLAKHEIVVVD
jgi:uncharacterized protein YjbI with pentapeptide repeats